MIYDITHVTTYSYEAPVASARCALRLLPRSDGGQSVLSGRIDVTPAAGDWRERVDFYGNRVAEARIDAPHVKLGIAMRARVRVERPAPPAETATPCWENVRSAAVGAASLDSHAPAHWLYPSRLAPLHEPATAYARESFAPGRPILEGAAELMRRIKADFVYDPSATHVALPLARAFQMRSGVCQDFTHIMIAGLRGLGLPAAYVSGYIRTIPPPGCAPLEGADASHAWMSLWCGEPHGWIDLDPTNAILVENDHVVIAVGRDYADVSPIDGVIFSAGRQKLDVSVSVTPVDSSAAR
ncbi:transglutaminase family protein [Methylosinus sp. Sm6]|uniref:transglutaminase family protein n=1 Tax=Methylosinus sp. Sm6 TaxID=2866948 RepID=UPI001C995494|nr:transglutaminase family protein [Methylosinus sp. Sm6]